VRATERASSDPTPMKQGNLYRGDPGEGRERFVMDSWLGNPSKAQNFVLGSPQRPRIAKRESETMTGRTVCLNWARTDLWEPRVSDHPRRPGSLSIGKVPSPLIWLPTAGRAQRRPKVGP
jgi:hypothetical protein